jgi:hypothetical protein
VLSIQGLPKARRVNLTQEFEDTRLGGRVVPRREGDLRQGGESKFRRFDEEFAH